MEADRAIAAWDAKQRPAMGKQSGGVGRHSLGVENGSPVEGPAAGISFSSDLLETIAGMGGAGSMAGNLEGIST